MKKESKDKNKVVWFDHERERHERSFKTQEKAIAFQEYLVFTCGLDAEVME